MFYQPANFRAPNPQRVFSVVSLTLMIILGFVLAVGWRWHFKTMATRADFIEMTTRMDALRKQQIMPGNTVVMVTDWIRTENTA